MSASNCIVDMLPEAWAIEWATYSDAERTKEASKWGITPEVLPEAIQWVTSRFESQDVGWPVVFYSVGAALEFAEQFVSENSDIVLLGIGLHHELVHAFLEEEKPPGDHGMPGVCEALQKSKSIEPGGKAMGFEVLGYEWGGFHSWLCNGLEVDCSRELSIQPNARGFIDTFEDAAKSAEYVSQDVVGAEPVFWQPWLVIHYPIKLNDVI